MRTQKKPVQMIKQLRHLWFFLFICLSFCVPVAAQVTGIWALGDGEKIFRDDLHPASKEKNYTWDGHTIRLKGLYNEVLAFQVIVTTGQKGASGVELAITLPEHQPSGRTIGGNTLSYGPGGSLAIFTEHYLHVTDSTQPNWYYGSSAAAPRPMTGWIPDALIPSDALPGQGGSPIDIGANRNQGFWVDVALPRDQSHYPAGVYRGTVEVREAGKLVGEIPLEISLLPHYLPDKNLTTVWLFTSNVHDYYPAMSQEQVDKMVKFEGHRHRIDVVGGFAANTRPFDEKLMDRYKPYLDGTGFTPAYGYHGPGEGVGEQIFPIGMYASPVLGTTRDTVRRQASLWVNWFEKNAPAVKYFWYLIDEPRKDKYAWIRERAAWIHNDPGEGKRLPVFTTTAYHPELKDAIDIWAGYDGVDLKDLPSIRQRGGDHWFYNGNRPRYGSVILEASAVDFRVDCWMMYKYNIHTYFLWEGTHWDHNGQGPKRHLHQNVFNNPLTFINNGLEFGNGDGIVLYPGHMPFYPNEDRGLNRLIPSIRLNNIRRGQQDVLIMSMAAKKVGREKVLQLINSVIPRGFSEVSMDEAVPWSQHGDDYDKIRAALLDLL
jgi:hypothetical protein